MFLCGFSQGAALALHAGTQYPTALGGIIAFAGWLPGPLTVAPAHVSTSTRVLLLHGSHDSKVPGILSESARDILSAKGLSVTRVELTAIMSWDLTHSTTCAPSFLLRHTSLLSSCAQTLLEVSTRPFVAAPALHNYCGGFVGEPMAASAALISGSASTRAE